MKIDPKWRCEHCSEIHDSEWTAEECCPTEITRVYLCPECDTAHNGEAAAEACCCDPDAPLPLPTAVELEAAGQARLID
jgi:hypothetical protein